MINFSKMLFWDVKVSNLDAQKDRFFIIERTMNYGLWDDFVSLVQYYGKDIIRQEIVKSAYLKKNVVSFLCLYLNLKPSQFKCYRRRQSSETHWGF